MNNEHVKSAADKASGALKETAGKITGNEKLEAEGKFDKAKGEVRETVGDIKDAAKNANKPA